MYTHARDYEFYITNARYISCVLKFGYESLDLLIYKTKLDNENKKFYNLVFRTYFRYYSVVLGRSQLIICPSICLFSIHILFSK